MKRNNELIRSISTIMQYKFFIPAYQRGYRWTEQQVKNLLNDMSEFEPVGDDWYCLQPLVVKKMKLVQKDDFSLINGMDDNVWYEVIDGQQRLTTIFLIIHYFNEMWVGKQKIKEPTIKYETRTNSFEFLSKINVDTDDKVNIDDTNTDYWHISKAYETIHKWVKDKGNFDYNYFQSKFKEKTKVIWYETNEKNAIKIFTRINMGKIPLTNAELIKALYLNSSNFKNDDEKIRLKQLEISNEWDFIEYSLHNQEFWWFINKDKNEKDNRIELLFELIVGKPKIGQDDTYTFREYATKFKSKSEQEIEHNWKQVKRYFQILQDWYNCRELYHKIGFLITLGEDIKSLINISQTKDKADFIEFIITKIKQQFTNVQLADIEYNNGIIKPILLLHNIQTILNNTKENSRFPFNRFKEEKWDIEHIHAIATEIPKSEQHQEDWIKQAKEFLNEKDGSDLLREVENYSKDNFEKLFNKLLNYFNEKGIHEEINDLSNLTLLDIGTNRSYKNSVFPVKRKIIIENEKKGTFIPICSRNVFMKYYSPKIEQMTFWGETDRAAYFENIKEILKPYLPNQNY